MLRSVRALEALKSLEKAFRGLERLAKALEGL
jgi:hypothetical protein